MVAQPELSNRQRWTRRKKPSPYVNKDEALHSWKVTLTDKGKRKGWGWVWKRRYWCWRQAKLKAKGTWTRWSSWRLRGDSHHPCLWPAESVLSSPAGRWRWTVLLWSILVQSPGRSSCTDPSWLWIVPEWERKRARMSSDSVRRSWGTDGQIYKNL